MLIFEIPAQGPPLVKMSNFMKSQHKGPPLKKFVSQLTAHQMKMGVEIKIQFFLQGGTLAIFQQCLYR